MRKIQVVVKTDYQDIYRITGGVLLIVDKFKILDDTIYSVKTKPYNKLTQYLRVTQTYCETWNGNKCQQGTITYGYNICKLVDKEFYKFKVKTSGEDFSGYRKTIFTYIEDIQNIIKSYYA